MTNTKLIFEGTIKVLKNTFTTVEQLPETWVKKPIMKKVIHGVEIQEPTGYRIYKCGALSKRIWVFGDLEINPDRHNVNKVEKTGI